MPYGINTRMFRFTVIVAQGDDTVTETAFVSFPKASTSLVMFVVEQPHSTIAAAIMRAHFVFTAFTYDLSRARGKSYSLAFHFLTILQNDANPTAMPTTRDASFSHASIFCWEITDPIVTEPIPTAPFISAVFMSRL
jgi:hypothetical protein